MINDGYMLFNSIENARSYLEKCEVVTHRDYIQAFVIASYSSELHTIQGSVFTFSRAKIVGNKKAIIKALKTLYEMSDLEIELITFEDEIKWRCKENNFMMRL